MTAQQRLAMFGYVAAGLGALEIHLGLPRLVVGGPGKGCAGYFSAGTGCNCARLFAGLLALGETLEKKSPSLLPGAAAVGGLLITFGVMVGTPDGVDVEVGLILALITSLAAGRPPGLRLAERERSDRAAAPAARRHVAAYGPPSGPPPGYGPPPGGGYGPPPSGYAPPPQ